VLASFARSVAAVAGVGPPGAPPVSAQPAAPANPMVSALALDSHSITRAAPSRSARRRGRSLGKSGRPARSNEGLGPERARILLRSLTVPGWGQATLAGRAARACSYSSRPRVGRVQRVSHPGGPANKTPTWQRPARRRHRVARPGRRVPSHRGRLREQRGVQPARRDPRRGQTSTCPIPRTGPRRLPRLHPGALDRWRPGVHWSDEAAFRRYGGQRKFAQRAGLRANTALGLAIANRLVSALQRRPAGRPRRAGRPGLATGRAAEHGGAGSIPGRTHDAFLGRGGMRRIAGVSLLAASLLATPARAHAAAADADSSAADSTRRGLGHTAAEPRADSLAGAPQPTPRARRAGPTGSCTRSRPSPGTMPPLIEPSGVLSDAFGACG